MIFLKMVYYDALRKVKKQKSGSNFKAYHLVLTVFHKCLDDRK